MEIPLYQEMISNGMSISVYCQYCCFPCVNHSNVSLNSQTDISNPLCRRVLSLIYYRITREYPRRSLARPILSPISFFFVPPARYSSSLQNLQHAEPVSTAVVLFAWPQTCYGYKQVAFVVAIALTGAYSNLGRIDLMITEPGEYKTLCLPPDVFLSNQERLMRGQRTDMINMHAA